MFDYNLGLCHYLKSLKLQKYFQLQKLLTHWRGVVYYCEQARYQNKAKKQKQKKSTFKIQTSLFLE